MDHLPSMERFMDKKSRTPKDAAVKALAEAIAQLNLNKIISGSLSFRYQNLLD